MGRTVVVVDQERVLREVISEILTDQGYRTILWHQSHGAFELISRTQPDIVIVDSWMEERANAWNLIQLLSSDASTSSIPIVVTADDPALLGDKAVVLQQLGHDIVRKPFDIDQLIGAIERLIGRGGRTAPV